MTLTPRSFPALLQCDAISLAAVESHIKLYEGYVQKYNELAAELAEIRQRGIGSAGDAEAIKGDLTFALSAIKNHELYFDGLKFHCDGS